MIKKIKKMSYGLFAAFLFSPAVIYAASLTEGNHPYFGIGSPKGAGDESTTFVNIIQNIIVWLLGFVGALSVLMIILAGIMYITSGGDEGRVEKAKNWLIYAIVGLIIALLGWVIVKTVAQAL